jgi:hypothetical protein
MPARTKKPALEITTIICRIMVVPASRAFVSLREARPIAKRHPAQSRAVDGNIIPQA